MNKQPSIYQHRGGYHVISLPGRKHAWTGYNRWKAFLFPGLWGKAMGFYCLFLLATSIGPALRLDTSRLLIRDQQAGVAAVQPATGTLQPARQLSLEYSGLFYLRITITRPDPAADLLFSSIDITTSLKPNSTSSN